MNRQDIDSQYSVTLTDNQWRILQQEVAGKDDNETAEEVILDVITNLADYEEEHAWWDSELAKASSK